MKVYIFGNKSSPAVANYGLGKTAALGESEFGKDGDSFVRARAMKKKLEGPKYIVTKEAPLWLALMAQDNFLKFDLLEWLNVFFLC